MDPFVEKYHDLSNEQKKRFLDSLPKDISNKLYLYPELKAYKQQLIDDEGEWRYHILLASRSWGKSMAGSIWMARQVLNKEKSLAVVSPTYNDLVGVTIPLIKSHFPENECYFNKQEKTLTFKNYPAIIYAYSAESEIRGPSIACAWLDELAKWNDGLDDKIQNSLDVLDFAVRVGKHPRLVITTTPKPLNVFKNFVKLSEEKPTLYRLKNGVLMDNPFLPKNYVNAMVSRYDGTRIGEQELYGKIINDLENSLFNRNMINKNRITLEQYKSLQIKRCIIAVDPAITVSDSSDETGIIVAALGQQGKVYILHDASGKYTPDQWAKKVITLYDTYQCDRIIAEKNQGGLMVSHTLQTVSRNANIKLITATRGKVVRAEPVAALYEQGRICHVGVHSKLEDQMCVFTNDPSLHDDRVDAMVYSATELILEKNYANRDLSPIGFF